jgi:hypothetical protein
MRLACQRFAGERGFTEAEFRDTAEEIAGVDLKEWWRRSVFSAEELDYSDLLDAYGLQFVDAKGPSGAWTLRIRDDATGAQTAQRRACWRRLDSPDRPANAACADSLTGTDRRDPQDNHRRGSGALRRGNPTRGDQQTFPHRGVRAHGFVDRRGGGGYAQFRQGLDNFALRGEQGDPAELPPKLWPDRHLAGCHMLYTSVRREDNGSGWRTDYPWAQRNPPDSAVRADPDASEPGARRVCLTSGSSS